MKRCSCGQVEMHDAAIYVESRRDLAVRYRHVPPPRQCHVIRPEDEEESGPTFSGVVLGDVEDN